MKILYLTPFGYDYLPDQLYTGLCKLLGVDSVIDYPWKPEYHDPSCRIPSIPQNSARPYEFEEVCSLIEEHKIDLVVLTAQRRGTVETLESFSNKCSLPPLVLVDSSDSASMHTALFNQFQPGIYFKREYHGRDYTGAINHWGKWKQFGSDEELFRRTYPLQMSAVLETMPVPSDQPRPIDISFNGFVSHRHRIKAVNMLRGISDITFQGGVYADTKTRMSKLAGTVCGSLWAKIQGDPYVTDKDCQRKLSYQEHFRLLQRSKLGLSMRGSGFDTVRYWEIPALKTLLISERPSIYIPNNFEHGKHAIFCKPDLSDLVDLVKEYARDHEARNRLAESGYAHLLKYHTCEKRASQFLVICKEKL